MAFSFFKGEGPEGRRGCLPRLRCRAVLRHGGGCGPSSRRARLHRRRGAFPLQCGAGQALPWHGNGNQQHEALCALHGLAVYFGAAAVQNESIFFNEKDTGDGRGEFSPAKYKCLEYVDWDISGKAPAPTTTQPGAPGNKKRAPATKAQRGAPGKKRAPAKGI